MRFLSCLVSIVSYLCVWMGWCWYCAEEKKYCVRRQPWEKGRSSFFLTVDREKNFSLFFFLLLIFILRKRNWFFVVQIVVMNEKKISSSSSYIFRISSPLTLDDVRRVDFYKIPFTFTLFFLVLLDSNSFKNANFQSLWWFKIRISK